ncbi:hypothetical protein Zm00014a_021363 [Zea mays]|uniref:Uncharacterized protein n=1 Tax=Zea mays TaxID=4577 RepID=A0A3L6EVH9_MAIZE|nr:hypothetical protein Zm00014a_021363 [Zea mays]
MLRTCYLVTQ